MKKQQPTENRKQIQKKNNNSDGKQPTGTTKTVVSKNVSIGNTEKWQENNKEWPTKDKPAKEWDSNENESNLIASKNIPTSSGNKRQECSNENEWPTLLKPAQECTSIKNHSSTAVTEYARTDEASTWQGIKAARLSIKVKTSSSCQQGE